jgi:hypothetical protein
MSDSWEDENVGILVGMGEGSVSRGLKTEWGLATLGGLG